VPVFRLSRQVLFPDPSLAEEDGLLAVGGDLSPDRILRAYAEGIFPWFNEGSPVLWWSPDPRLVLLPEELHVSASLARTMRRGTYRVTADTAFGEVIRGCARSRRSGQSGTWITDEMIAAYEELHAAGFAHSFESWTGDSLAGGLYGVSLGGLFFGESMFSERPDASKVAFARSVEYFVRSGIELVDCQVRTDHLIRLGARDIPRTRFLDRLDELLEKPTVRGKWKLVK
jgi:leucyl/phenylalanyl-tRNA--protein transferase